MTTPDGQIASANAAFPSVTPGSADSSITLGWFVRRSVLWLVIVATGVSAACLLYAAAGGTKSAAAKSAPSAAQTTTAAEFKI